MLNGVVKCYVCLLIGLQGATALDQSYTLQNEAAVRKFFDYFKTDDPKGIPVVTIEDPYYLPFNLRGPSIVISNTSVFGHSQLVIEGGYIDVEKLMGHAEMSIPIFTIAGKYEHKALLSSNIGEINATINHVNYVLNVSMVIEDGVLQMQDMNQNFTKDEFYLHLTNLTWFQEILYNSGALHMFFHPLAELAFNQNKAIILNETNQFLRNFSNSLPSVLSLPYNNQYYDQILTLHGTRRNLVLFVNRLFHYAEFDPIRPPSKTLSVIGVNVKLTDIKVSGLSSVTDINALTVFYLNKKIRIEVSMIFPHILVRYNAAFSRFFLKVKSQPRKINLHNLETNVTIVIDPSRLKSIQKIDFNGKSDWIGNINRYNSDSVFRKFLNRIEKFMQTHFLRIFIKIVQPEIEARLKDLNLEKAIVSFLRNM